MILPISLSPLAEMVPTWAISSLEVTFLAFAFSSATMARNRQVDAALEVHRVGAGRHRLRAFADDGLGEHGRRGGAVAGDVGGLGGDLLQHLRAHVLELVLELDLLGDGDAVLGDAGCAVALLQHDVAALGAQRHANGVGEDVDAAQHPLAGVLRELDVFGCHVWHLQVGLGVRPPSFVGSVDQHGGRKGSDPLPLASSLIRGPRRALRNQSSAGARG